MLKNIFRSRGSRRSIRRVGFKPSMESLEGRWLPSTVTLNFNSLPSAQGWTYVNGHSQSPDYTNCPENSVFSVDGTKLTLNDLGQGQAIPHYEYYAIDPSQPFSIEARAKSSAK